MQKLLVAFMCQILMNEQAMDWCGASGATSKCPFPYLRITFHPTPHKLSSIHRLVARTGPNKQAEEKVSL